MRTTTITRMGTHSSIVDALRRYRGEIEVHYLAHLMGRHVHEITASSLTSRISAP